jgi:hypothetical protein
MSRRSRRRSDKVRRHSPEPSETSAAREVVREAAHVERLAYTRSQAAAALGISRSTFIRRVLPQIETLDMPWGTKLIPVDELERVLAERRRPAASASRHPSPPGRKAQVPDHVIARIRTQRADGKSFAAIARDLTTAGVETSQGGRQWWPSTVRAVLARSEPLDSA